MEGPNKIKKVLNYIFCYHVSDNGFWFRIFDYGLVFTHKSEKMLFSERNGYIKYITIGNYRIKFLDRWKTL